MGKKATGVTINSCGQLKVISNNFPITRGNKLIHIGGGLIDYTRDLKTPIAKSNSTKRLTKEERELLMG